MAINLIGEDTIKEGIKSFLKTVTDLKAVTELYPEEAELIGIIYERNGNLFGSLATVNNERKIIRVIDPKNLEELAMQILKSM